MPTINFHISEELKDIVPHPIPAAKAVPDWYKKMPTMKRPQNAMEMETVKKCLPVRDLITAGYIIPNWHGLRLEISKGEIQSHADNDALQHLSCGASFHQIEQIKGSPLEHLGDGKKILKLLSPWVVKTPRGYSTLFLAPQYRENDIEILPAIVDTDEFYTPVNFPAIMLKQKCNVEQGVPMVQAIPFKRESWTSSVQTWDVHRAKQQTIKLMSRITSSYTTDNWIRKIFR